MVRPAEPHRTDRAPRGRERLRARTATLRASLTNPDLRRVQLGWAASTGGEHLAAVAIGVEAYAAGGAAAVGLLGVVSTVPQVVSSPFTALLGDRCRREVVVGCTDLLRCLVVAAAAVAVATGAGLAVLAVLAALLSVLTGTYYPSQTALVPLLARSAQEVTAAAATAGLLRSFASLAAPALAGAVLLAGSGTALLALTAAAFAVAALLVLRVPRTDAVRSAPAMTGAWSALTGGFRAAAADRATVLVLAVFLVSGVARGALAVLLVVLPLELLGTGSAGVGFVGAVLGLGAFFGALASTSLTGRRRLAGPMALGLLLTGLPLLLAAAVPAAAVVLTAVAVVGGALALLGVGGTTLLVRSVRDDVLSRVLGVLGTVRGAGMALGSGLVPPLLASTGVRGTLAALGAALLLVVLLARPGLRRVDAAAGVPEAELAALRAAPVFRPLPPVAVERLASRLEALEVPAGQAVVEEGDDADGADLLVEGEVVVEAAEAGGDVVDRMGPGDVFGEMALLHGARRNATVRADTDCRLYRLGREEFLAAVTGHAASAAQAHDLVAERLAHRRRVVGG